MTDGAKLELILSAKDLASREVGKLHNGLRRLHSVAGKLGGGLKTAGAHVLKFGLIAGAAALTGLAALTAGILGAAKAEAAEQVGIQRLNASLKANIKGWKGNTDAIEKRIAAGEKLGFADDEQRDSLAKLIARYGNLSKAQKVQTLAMDFARLKNVDLGTATEQVAKGLDGNAKILKSLGIEYKAGGDKATLFGKIQDKVRGQAKAFGNTAAGAMAAIKITMGDVVEQLGTLFLPVLTRVAIFIRDNVVPALSMIVSRVGAWLKANGPLIAQIAGFIGGALSKLAGFLTSTVIPAIGGKGGKGGLVASLQAAATSVGKVVGPILKALVPALGKVATAIFGGGGKVGKTGKKGKGSAGLVGAIASLIGVLWGDGNGALAQIVKIVGAAFTDVLLPAIATIIDKISDLIGWVRDAIKWLNSLNLTVNKVRGANVGHDPIGDALFGNGRAGGGPMPPGRYVVGERRPESLVVSRGGGVFMEPSAARASSRGGGDTYNLNFTFPPTDSQMKTVVDAIDRYRYRNRASSGSGNRF